MPRFKRMASVLLLMLLAACTKPAPPPSPNPPEVTKPAEPAGPQPPKGFDQWLQYMTAEEKVGQLLWFGLPGTTPSPEAQELIAQGKAGGFIFFGRQGTDPSVLRHLIDELQKLASSRGRFTPGLIISVDQEGGRVQRFLEQGFTPWPGAMAIGATGSEAYAEQVARAMAQELRQIGINLNLAPDADVNNNPANPVIGVRSFGEDPRMVSRLVAASVRGFRAGGVAATAKHFPGHGDTSVDSHLALPVVGHPIERLEKVELPPFRAAIEAEVDAILAAHVIFSAVATDGLPATLSPKVLQGLLKEQLGFKGLVITDAIDTMKAITDNYGVEKAIVMAVQAGADALLVTESFGRHSELHGILLKAVQNGEIPQARLDDAVRRNLELKARLGLLPGTKPSLPARTAEAQPSQLAAKVGADALTLVRNKHLPLKLTTDQMILAIGPGYAAKVTGTEGVLTALGAGLKAQHQNVQEVTLGYTPGAESLAAARALAAKASVIVYAVFNGHNSPEHQAFLKELIASGKPVIVVGMGEPYELTALPQIQTYIAAYGYQTPNLQGVGALTFGKAPAKGKLPVRIPGLYPLGHGLSL